MHKVGVIGAGAISQMMHLPVLTAMADVKVAWVIDVDAEAARQAGRAFGVEHLGVPASLSELPECDAALLAIPVHARADYYAPLAARGTAVLVEKPLSANLADQLAIEAQFAPERIACGYMRRFYAGTQLLRQIVHEGWFGPLRACRVHEGARVTGTGVDRTYFDQPSKNGGGALLNVGCHGLDAMLFITGASACQVQRRELRWDGETDRDVQASVLLQGIAGDPEVACELDFHITWLWPIQNTLRLEFDRVVVEAGTRADAVVRVGTRGHGPAAVITPPPGGATTSNQAFYLEWEAFLQGLRDGRPSAIAAERCRLTAGLIDDILAGAMP